MVESKRCNVCGTLFCEPEDLPPGCPECRRMQKVRRKEFWDKCLVYVGGSLFILLPTAGYLYMQARPSHVTYIFDFTDPATWMIWPMLLFGVFMCAGLGYLFIREAWKWLREKNSDIKVGNTTLWWVIIDAILLLTVAWFVGSAGMRFISQ
jgi:hypothetical protein